MNLVKTLSQPITKAQCDKIVAYIGEDKTRFNELMDAFLEGNYRVTQRAAWPLSYATQKHPHLIKPYLKKIILNLKKPGIHDAVKRNTVRLLQFISIPKTHQGIAMETCFALLLDTKEPIAIRVFSMTVLANLCEEHPELANELRTVIEDQMPYSSAAFLSRGSKILKKLEKMKAN